MKKSTLYSWLSLACFAPIVIGGLTALVYENGFSVLIPISLGIVLAGLVWFGIHFAVEASMEKHK